jgi:ComF family protein
LIPVSRAPVHAYTRVVMMQVFGRASRVALDLFFPPQCALCGRGGRMLCDECAAALPAADGARCPRCWMPSLRGRTCRHCTEAPPSFDTLRAAFVMDGGARRLVHELKYDGMTALAEPMAQLMTDRIELHSADLMAPVPLHRSRERSRGYNQSAMLARSLASMAGVAYDGGAARRVRATVPLVKTMSRDERLTIMRGAFAGERRRVEGRHVLLIDDVATTGATLDACAEALLSAGARRVRAVVFARAD